jgi:LemA protein
MKRSTWIIIGVIAVAVIYAISLFNRVKRADVAVSQQWSNVENAYQLRADKTKNLLEIVKGAADFERGTLTDVIEARAKATQVKLDADDLTPENIKAFEDAQANFSSALSRLLVTIERYPDLKAVAAFRDFQAQYEGMENRIGVERRKFNEAVGSYNGMIVTFPGNLFAGLFGFQPKGFFQGEEGTEKAPDISFE